MARDDSVQERVRQQHAKEFPAFAEVLLRRAKQAEALVSPVFVLEREQADAYRRPAVRALAFGHCLHLDVLLGYEQHAFHDT